jgi:hypothetical protein
MLDAVWILQGSMRVDGLEGFIAGNARSHPDKAGGLLSKLHVASQAQRHSSC